MQVLPSCETITVLGFARFTWNNVLQSYILENFQSFVVFSKIKSVLFLIAFPNCCTGSTWISVTVLSHVSHFPLLIAHTHVFHSVFSVCVGVPDPEPVQELVYDLRSQCDAIRVTKTVRPFSMVCCPVNENAAALIVSDGRVMIWELKSSISGRNVRNR